MDDEPKKITVTDGNWSEAVEDLVSAGDTDAAISLLESLIADFETAGGATSSSLSDRQLASALGDLAGLYSSGGLSLKADHLRSRATLIKHRLLHSPSNRVGLVTTNDDLEEDKPNSSSHGNLEKSMDFASPGNENSDDDWETIADLSPDKLLAPQTLPGLSDLSLEDNKPKVPKRRGRGTFSYKKQELYSDNLSDNSNSDHLNDDNDDEDVRNGSERDTEIRHSTYGTSHVLVLADFSPSAKTIDLEKLFVDFRGHGFVIRWINDTTALAVFSSPSLALEAKSRVKCPFTVNILDANDDLLSSIPPKDLEPPRQRPKTSASTAQRLIAHGMGLKLPSKSFGSKEFKKQEGDRKERIVSRQKLKDDAWGSED